ncbi:DNA cytosine methyltransferase [Desertivirga xinjiangensis]|uniref:DNA cytosine methyltransferase n=1 Tax=Desertivirga xinjiangensis TaxID=539206 RepID=UPI00210E0E53|nr:DNA cytosine methyltransferase [Pedobacter xinjiangensis]
MINKQNFLYSEGGGFNPKVVANPEEIEFVIIDLFCGFGGTTTGFDQAMLKGKKCALVIACINHDPKAIKSHWLNHPEVVHFEEDIRTVELHPIVELLIKYRLLYPNAKIILWASLECTNFSKAKGGQPRDADSRTLADHLDRYILALNPDYIMIENVVEFMSWGPLDENGKPVSKRSGADWLRWCAYIDSLGYRNEWREMNSADFGAYTSRNRLFGCFAKPGLPIIWPEPTHSKKPEKADLFGGGLKKWKAVKDVLDFDDEGQSIFTRKKPLSDKTLERIYAGLVKYVAGGKDAFLVKWNSMSANGRYYAPSLEDPCPVVSTQNRIGACFIAKYYSGDPNGQIKSIESPADAILCKDHHSIINASFITKYFSGRPEGKCIPVDGPAGTITTVGNQTLVQPKFVVNPAFIAKYYGNGDNISSINEPAGTLTTKDRLTKVQPVWIDKTYSGKHNHQSVEQPAGAVMTNNHFQLVQTKPFIMNTSYGNEGRSVDEPAPTLLASRRHHYIVNPSHGGHSTSTESPCPVIVARQDKAPLYLAQAIPGLVEFGFDNFFTKIDLALLDEWFEIETEYGPTIEKSIRVKIIEFMLLYGIADIKMRMLKVSELLPIQGFPKDYKYEGNQGDAKKFIGNSVVPHVVKSWCEALGGKLKDSRRVHHDSL